MVFTLALTKTGSPHDYLSRHQMLMHIKDADELKLDKIWITTKQLEMDVQE